MTDFLIKIFIKDNNIKKSCIRQKYLMLAVALQAIISIAMFIVKIVIGMFLNSVAIIADSFNNLSDSFVSLVLLLGVKLGNKPPDSEHPFGHGRFEYFLVLIISATTLFLGFEFLRISIGSILRPEEVGFSISFIIILITTVIIKFWMACFNNKVGKIIDSKILVATAKDSINDIIITIAAISSVVFTHVTGIIIDGYVGVIVACILFYSGYQIAKDTISKLLGESIDPKLAKNIKAIVETYEEVLGSHDLIVHNYGPTNSMATIHVEVSNKMSIDQAHDIIDKIEREVKNKLGITLVIHVDPIPVNDNRVRDLKLRVLDYIGSIGENIDAHDFKIVDKKGKADVIFELVFPHHYDKDKEHIILVSLVNIVKTLDKNYNCIIELEHRYIKEE